MQQRRSSGSMVGGLILVVIGALYLISNLGGLSFGRIAPFTGPVITIVLGLYFLYRIYGPDRKPDKVAFPWPLFMIFGGLSAMAAIAGYWRYTVSIGPVALIIVGGWMLLRRSR